MENCPVSPALFALLQSFRRKSTTSHKIAYFFSVSLDVSTEKEKGIICANKNLVVMHSTSDEVTKLFEIKQFPFTNVGCEIASLMTIDTPNEDLISFAKVLRKENKNIDIGVYDIINRIGESINYKLENLLNEQNGDVQ